MHKAFVSLLSGCLFFLTLSTIASDRSPSTAYSPEAALGGIDDLKDARGNLVFAYQRKSCSEYYPASGSMTNCTDIGRSGCGGPDQCSCASSERLVTYRCSEGTFNLCQNVGGC
jgi:hypothetical protein